MQALRKYLPIAFFIAFLTLGLMAFFASKPTAKNARVYKTVQKYSPYYMDKRFGGIQIMSKADKEFKEKPTNMTLFTEFERLEREWGKSHLKIQDDILTIIDDNQTTLFNLPLQTDEERSFAHHYYGI